jgi:hypothetical protein
MIHSLVIGFNLHTTDAILEANGFKRTRQDLWRAPDREEELRFAFSERALAGQSIDTKIYRTRGWPKVAPAAQLVLVAEARGHKFVDVPDSPTPEGTEVFQP